MSYGNAHQCPVTKALKERVWTSWNERFGAAEQSAKEAEYQAHSNRLKTEPVFVGSPDGTPRLLDEIIPSTDTPRARDDIDRVEYLLRGMGFARRENGNQFSWVFESDVSIVYANPYYRGKVPFSVYRKRVRKASQYQTAFDLRDGWADWPTKFKVRIDKG